MDFSLREWLIILGVILILGVLLDGYRRMRSGRRNSIKLAIDKNFAARSAGEPVDYFHGELPGGGARLVQPKNGLKREMAGVPDLDDEDDLLPDPLFADDRDDDLDGFDAIEDAPYEEQMPSASYAELPEELDEPLVETRPSAEEPAPASPKITRPPVEEVLVINVFAKNSDTFNGADILRLVLACGMRFGDMEIFHRHEKGAAPDQPQFSMANAVKPGTFDLDTMESFETPGVSFFMSLPGPIHSMKAFDQMLDTAQCLVSNLNGELQDEGHSVMTKQTIEHARQRVRDFERRQLSLLR